MRDFDTLAGYAKDRVQTTQVPLDLYAKAERRKNAIDSAFTVLVATVLLWLSTVQLTSKVSIQTPVVREYLKHDLVASGGSR